MKSTRFVPGDLVSRIAVGQSRIISGVGVVIATRRVSAEWFCFNVLWSIAPFSTLDQIKFNYDWGLSDLVSWPPGPDDVRQPSFSPSF